MKNLINIIQEKLKVSSNTKVSNSSIDLLVELLIKQVLYDQNIKKSDFKLIDKDDNIYSILNVPQDKIYWQSFYKEIINYQEDFKCHGWPMDKRFPDDYFKVALKDDKHEFIVLNLYSDGLNSIDVTENIKNLILNKIK